MPEYASATNASAPKLSDRPASSTVGRLNPRPKSVTNIIKRQRPSSQQFCKSSLQLRQDSVPIKFLIDYSPGPDPVSRVMRRRAVPQQKDFSHEPAKPPDFTDSATRPSSHSRSSISKSAVPPQMPKTIYQGDLIPSYGDPSYTSALKPAISPSWRPATNPYKGPRRSNVFATMGVELDLPLPSEVKWQGKSGKPAFQRAAFQVQYSSSSRSFSTFTELSTTKECKKCRVSFALDGASPPLAADKNRGEANITGERDTGQLAEKIYLVEQHQNEFTEKKQPTMQRRIQDFQEAKAAERNSKEERSHSAKDQSAVTGERYESTSGIGLDQGEGAVLLSPIAMHNAPEQQEVETSLEASVEFESQTGVPGPVDQQEEKSGETKASDEGLNYISYQVQKHSMETGAPQEIPQKSECVKKEGSGSAPNLKHGTALIYNINADTNDDENDGHSCNEDVRTNQPKDIAMQTRCKQEVVSQSSENRKSLSNPSQTPESNTEQQSQTRLRTASAGADTTHRKGSQKIEPRSSCVQDATKRKPSGQNDATSVRGHGGKCASQCPSQQTQAVGVQQKQKRHEKHQCGKEQSGSATQKDTPLDYSSRQRKDQRCQSEICAAAVLFEVGAPAQPTSESRQGIPASCQEVLKLDAERRKRRVSAEMARIAALREALSGRPCLSGWPANNGKKKRPACDGEKCKHDMKLPAPCRQEESSTTWIRECNRMVKLVHGKPVGIQVISRLPAYGDIYWIMEESKPEDWPLGCEEACDDCEEGPVEEVASDPPSDNGGEGTDEGTGDPVIRTKVFCC